MRTVENNPFVPGSDVVPEIWAGRRHVLADYDAELRAGRHAGNYVRGRFIYGEPGVGKSVLVGRIAATARNTHGDWTTGQVRLPRRADPFQLVAEALLDVAAEHVPHLRREQSLGDLLSRVEQLAAAGVSAKLRAPSGRPAHRELFDLIVAIAQEARRSGVMVLVHVDEVQNMDLNDTGSALLTALGDALNETVEVDVPGGTLETHLPIAIYLTGLPEFNDAATSRLGATFARRFKPIPLAPLHHKELLAGLRPLQLGWEVTDGSGGSAFVTMDADAASALADVSFGDPFLFQLIGHAAWLADEGGRLTADHVAQARSATLAEAKRHVDRLLDRLSDKQMEFVQQMVRLAPEDRTLSSIADVLDVRPEQLGSTTQGLDVKGIISRGKPYQLRVPAIEARLTGDLADIV